MLNRGLIIGLVVAGFAAGASADWPRFRGANGAGVAPGANTLASFSASQVQWKIDLPGIGHSSPVVAGRKIFVTCAEPETAKRYLICVSLDTGKELWRKEHNSHTFRQHNDNSYASASPAADDQRVYYTFIAPESYSVYCVDQNGKDLWSYDMGPWKSEHGCGCSPIVFEDLLIVPNDQDGPTASLVALDKVDGSKRWSINRKPGRTAASTPCIFAPASGAPSQLILTCSGSGITSIDPKTGHENWNMVVHPPTYRSVGSPVASDQYVVGSWGEGGSSPNRVILGVKPSGSPGQEPQVLFKLTKANAYPYVPSPVIKGDRMFLWSDVGTVTCFKLPGGEPIWQEKVKSQHGRTEFYSSPILAGEKLYNISKDGEAICVSAGEKFQDLGHSELGDKCFATPAVDGNALVIRTASHLMLVGGK
jgi:outer membrane protein assembly factor BamB